MLWDKIKTVEQYLLALDLVGYDDDFVIYQLFKFFANKMNIENRKILYQIWNGSDVQMSLGSDSIWSDTYTLYNICRSLKESRRLFPSVVRLKFSRIDYHIFKDTVPMPEYLMRFDMSMIRNPEIVPYAHQLAGAQDEIWRIKNYDIWVLGDMLEEEGVDPDSHLMKHIRYSDRHYSNCWALNLLIN